MTRILKAICLPALILALSACSSYKVHLDSSYVPPEVEQNVPLQHRVYFLGDAGEETDIQQRNLKLLKTLADTSSVPYTCVFLGDNIYPEGMPSKKDSINRPIAEAALMRQMEVLADGAEDVIFIGGNHDWKKGHKGGRKAIRRQEDFIDDYDRKNIKYMPEAGCPGPEVVKLTNDVVLLLIDSQWWLQDWSREKNMNDNCEIRTRFEFLSEITNTVKDYKEKQIIIALHHPLVSGGSHGGYFTWQDHLFPLTNISHNLYIPLPVIGSLFPIYRSTYGHVQDQPHPKYTELIEALVFAVQAYDNVVFVAGHEHALEYHERNGNHLLVSGSASRVDPTAKTPTTRFAHGAAGFMQVDLHDRGGLDLAVWEPDDNGDASAPVFEVKLTESRKPIEVIVEDIPERPEQDSTLAVISEEYARTKGYRAFFGERYRALYNLPVMAKNIVLDDEHGGLVPVKKGGGFQTNSLRMEAPSEHQYVLRSLNKDATRLLPEIFQSTLANDILQDQFTASHPYAAFIVPELADAARIHHTNPEIVFLKNQVALGRYNGQFEEALYLYEERPSGDWSQQASFGNSDDIIGYSDLLEDRQKDYRNSVDQIFTLRSRLFDMFIGDWDRHDDQWRWASFDNSEGKGKTYRPIPRDRDQALSDYDGFLVTLANWYTPTLRKMSTFSGEIKRLKWFNFNARYFDRDYINEASRADWVGQAEQLKAALTDSIIDHALHQWPEEIYKQQGDDIAGFLKSRRDKLPEYADEYYEELAARVYVKGTDDIDYIVLTRFDDSTRVEVFDSNKEEEKNAIYYSRTFYDEETDAVEIYGLDGADHFEIAGTGKSSIRCYLVGGEGRDHLIKDPETKKSRIRAYDTHKADRNPGIKYHEVDDDFNTYDRTAFQYNYGIPLFLVGINPDDGLLIGGGYQFVRYGFRKAPFASRHSVLGSYSIGSGSFHVDYLGEWKHVIGRAGIDLDALYQSRSYVENFFGFGNDTEQDSSDIEFYRVRKRSFRVFPALTFGQDEGHIFKLHLGTQSHRVDSTDNRFITSDESGLEKDVFDDRRFLTAKVDYDFVSLDNHINPHRGIHFKATVGTDYEWEKDEAHQYIATSLALYFEFKRLGQTVLATRVGGEWHYGDYQFYQAARLGAHENFRGMHRQRLTGDRAFFHNTDLRFNVAQWRSYLIPTQMGLILSFDHGRVWQEEEISSTWHIAYGGGVWISPFQTLLLSLTYNVSDLDKRFDFQMGFFF